MCKVYLKSQLIMEVDEIATEQIKLLLQNSVVHLFLVDFGLIRFSVQRATKVNIFYYILRRPNFQADSKSKAASSKP